MKWSNVSIGSVAKVISGYAFKSSSFNPNGKVPIIKIANIKRGSIDLSVTTNVDESFLSIDNKYHVVRGDVLISLTGSHITMPNSVVGRVGKYQHDDVALLNQRAGKFLHNPKLIDKDYLYYYLTLDETLHRIASFAQGAANQANISPSDVESAEISLPPLPTQLRIASILSAYDDLIENNLRRIKLLEEAARCEYKMLMEERDEEVEFRELVKWVKGKKPKDISQIRLDGYLPYLVFDTIEGNAVTYANTEKVPFASTDDVLMCMDGARSGVVFRGMEGVLGSTFASLKLEHPELTEYVYQFLRSNLEYIVQGNVGAAIPHANKEYINSLKIAIPDDLQLAEYNLKVGLLVNLIANLKIQNTRLRQARDLLLPKLMSGEIDVRNQVEQAKLIQLPIQVSIAAEVEVVYETKKHKGGAKYYLRTVLAAYIVDTLWQEKTFGHVKLMKLMYLCEHLADIETVSNYHRDAAGPYDNQMIRSIDKQLREKHWFEMYKNQQGFPKYRPLDKHNDYKVEFEKYYRDKQIGIDSLLARFGKESTERVEMVATTYEAWRYLNSKQSSVNEDEIINEILNNWHDSKKRISEDRWRICYRWIKGQNWIV